MWHGWLLKVLKQGIILCVVNSSLGAYVVRHQNQDLHYITYITKAARIFHNLKKENIIGINSHSYIPSNLPINSTKRWVERR